MKSLQVNNGALIELSLIRDGRDGILSVVESNKQIPFEIKRIYYIYDLKDESAVRGKHAHIHNQQAIFCISGSFTMELDDGIHKQEIILDNPSTGIYMGVKLWHTMKNFSENCILLVLASDLYEEADYIRDYEEFKKYIQ
jgi:dTDP-4-dehydrorhamnose 3,5-epimerase-like enzyme